MSGISLESPSIKALSFFVRSSDVKSSESGSLVFAELVVSLVKSPKRDLRLAAPCNYCVEFREFLLLLSGMGPRDVLLPKTVGFELF